MVNRQEKLKLIDFDIAQTDVFATPDAGVPEAQFFLSVSRRLDHLDITGTSNGQSTFNMCKTKFRDIADTPGTFKWGIVHA
ncbi:hypothetical protein AJ79_07389 [Helicocarpus griseus UAMH5409]|uniref:Uncharacterized protein n=1 Tax=Helicocarpus griseus UAMH5409 TaxID=1447875 RepID=A0A2B7X3F5_9EURO|nr:hypothetical protein AJ79_07389 [Helicocarpus griseus UAMH5409]